MQWSQPLNAISSSKVMCKNRRFCRQLTHSWNASPTSSGFVSNFSKACRKVLQNKIWRQILNFGVGHTNEHCSIFFKYVLLLFFEIRRVIYHIKNDIFCFRSFRTNSVTTICTRTMFVRSSENHYDQEESATFCGASGLRSSIVFRLNEATSGRHWSSSA